MNKSRYFLNFFEYMENGLQKRGEALTGNMFFEILPGTKTPPPGAKKNPFEVGDLQTAHE